jgi:putative ABC transport system substrate-binding protein
VVLTACNPQQAKTTIGYVQISPSPALDQARDGVFKVLTDSGFIGGQNIRILENNAQGDLSMINTILQSFQSKGVDMIITCSTPCMVAACQTIRDIPVVFTVAFGPEQVGITDIPDNLYGKYDPWQADEIVDLMMECIPGLKVVGIPHNNSEPNAEYAVKRIEPEFEKRGIKVMKASVTSTNDLLQAAEYLASQHVEAFIIAADNTVYLGLPVVVKVATEKKIPIFVSDPVHVEKGAAVGYGISYYQWGYSSGLTAVEILKGRDSGKPRIETITTYDLIINRSACAGQGLVLPESVLARATRTIQ